MTATRARRRERPAPRPVTHFGRLRVLSAILCGGAIGLVTIVALVYLAGRWLVEAIAR